MLRYKCLDPFIGACMGAHRPAGVAKWPLRYHQSDYKKPTYGKNFFDKKLIDLDTFLQKSLST